MRRHGVSLVVIGILTLTQVGAALDGEALKRATIKHVNSVATVTAQNARPLQQALDAVRQEYGWTVDFEDPVYRPTEVVDDTDPQWRKEHPLSKGVTRVAGGKFTASFDESNPEEVSGPIGEERILRTLVETYSNSGNPGHFKLGKSEGRFAIIGVSAADGTANTSSIMDAPIDLEIKERNGYEAVNDILTALSQKTGTHVILMWLPNNIFFRAKVTIGGSAITPRSLMRQVINATSVHMYWDLLYDADVNTYGLSILPVTRAYYDAFGHKVEVQQ